MVFPEPGDGLCLPFSQVMYSEGNHVHPQMPGQPLGSQLPKYYQPAQNAPLTALYAAKAVPLWVELEYTSCGEAIHNPYPEFPYICGHQCVLETVPYVQYKGGEVHLEESVQLRPEKHL